MRLDDVLHDAGKQLRVERQGQGGLHREIVDGGVRIVDAIHIDTDLGVGERDAFWFEV